MGQEEAGRGSSVIPSFISVYVLWARLLAYHISREAWRVQKKTFITSTGKRKDVSFDMKRGGAWWGTTVCGRGV